MADHHRCRRRGGRPAHPAAGAAARYRIAAPNEALIITGRNAKAIPTGDIDLESGSARVIIGGRAIVRPIVDRAFVLSLSSRQIPVEVEGYSMNGIFLRLRGVAQVKVGGNVDDVRKASQRFLDQQQQIDHYTQEILSGTLRAVVGTLSVEQIIRDRASFASQVQAEAVHSMNNQGLVIDTFQISAIEDDGSYLRDWGRPEAALVAKQAAIAESNANRESTQASNLNLQQEAESKQAFDLRNAEIKEETDARQAVAEPRSPGPRRPAAEDHRAGRAHRGPQQRPAREAAGRRGPQAGRGPALRRAAGRGLQEVRAHRRVGGPADRRAQPRRVPQGHRRRGGPRHRVPRSGRGGDRAAASLEGRRGGPARGQAEADSAGQG